MTKLLVNFTRKIVYLLWLQNSGYIYSGIILPVNVTGKYSKSSFKIRRYVHNLTRFRFPLCILTLGGQPPPRHLATESHLVGGKVAWWGMPLKCQSVIPEGA